MRILYVEDDARMRALVRRGLTEEGHVVTAAGDGKTASDLAAGTYDVIVLDVMLPDGSGLDVVRALRARGCATPLLLLTARDTQADIVLGLDAGADDYLTKPFAFTVLLARLRALARRAPVAQTLRLTCGDLVLDAAAHTVMRADQPLSLTVTEFRLLECLLRGAGRVVTRRSLIENVWGFERDIEANTLDAFVRLLRQKVDRRGDASLIHTVRGVGYRMSDEAAS